MSDDVEETIDGLSEKRGALISELVGLMAMFIKQPTVQNYQNFTSALLKYLEIAQMEEQIPSKD